MTSAAPQTRLPDWRPRLVAYLASVSSQPFAYGTHDCALFAAGAVDAMTGHAIAAEYRGLYGSLKEGLKLMRREGLADHVALLRHLFEEVPTAFAMVGDIAVIGEVGTPALGIFEGEQILVLREGGLGLMPRAAATLAFRVP
ncbi:MAG: hypothetical protein EAZ40_03420 [Rhodobacterales bacterium]|nr:MAG: hypothetical protein EAZ40_03420 [Rhodobacterales bacterium]